MFLCELLIVKPNRNSAFLLHGGILTVINIF